MKCKPYECECGKPKRKGVIGCESCRAIEKSRLEAESTTGQLVGMLRHMDWALAADIADAIGMDRGVACSRIAYMLGRGMLEQRWEQGIGAMYRLKRRAA